MNFVPLVACSSIRSNKARRAYEIGLETVMQGMMLAIVVAGP